MIRSGVIALLLLLAQDPAETLVRDLGNDSVEVREEATRRLLDMGKAAVKALEPAAASDDPEVRQRARHILAVIDARDRVTPAVLAAVPEALDLVSAGDGTGLLRKLRDGEALLAKRIPTHDLAHCVKSLMALDLDPEGRYSAIHLYKSCGLRALGPDVARLLTDPDENVRKAAEDALTGKGRAARPVATDVIRALEDPRTGTRQAALRVLASLGGAEAELAIVGRFKDPDAFVRDEALNLVASKGLKGVIPALLPLTESENDQTRLHAIFALSKMGDPALAPKFVGWLSDPDPEIRVIASGALRSPACEDAVPSLRKALSDPEPSVREAALVTLTALKSRDAEPDVIALLRDANAKIRKQAALYLTYKGTPECVPRLIESLNDDNDEVRDAAFQALGTLKDLRARTPLKTLLRSDDTKSRWSATWALAQLGVREEWPEIVAIVLSEEGASSPENVIFMAQAMFGKDAGPEIMKLMREQDAPRLRQEAVGALARLNFKEAIPDILESLKSDNDGLRMSASNALLQMKAVEAVPRLMKQLADPDPKLRAVAANVLGWLRARESVPALIERLTDDDAGVVRAAVDSLGSLRAFEASSAILKLLENDDPAVRSRTIYVASSLKILEAVPRLREFLSSENHEVRSAAASALGQLGAKESIPDLTKLLGSKDSIDRRGCIYALMKLGADDAAPEIAKFLWHENDDARYAAIAALAALKGRDALADLSPLLEDDRVRLNVAFVLVEAGCKETAPILLEEPTIRGFFGLNALRRPQTYKAIREKQHRHAGKDFEPMKDVLKALGESAGIEMRLSDACAAARESRMVQSSYVFHYAPMPLPAAIGELCQFNDLGCILEEGRAVFMPASDVEAFWRDWVGRLK